MSKVIGIDLGTTNSVVSVMEGGEPTVITNPEGSRITPSVVGFTKDGQRLVGQLAKRQAVSNPDRTIASIKRHMGDSNYKVTVDGKSYTPQEISAMVLQKLKADAEAYLGETVSQDLEFTDDLRVLAEHLIVGIVDFIHVIVDVGGKVTVAAGHLELMVPKILGCKHFHSPFVKDGHPEDGVPIL